MSIKWRNYQRKGRGTSANYDVSVSVIKGGYSFIFRRGTAQAIRDNQWKYLNISVIDENTGRIYFNFIPGGPDSANKGVMLSEIKNAYRCTFRPLSDAEAEIVKKYWCGDYDVVYVDRQEGALYIERPKFLEVK